MSQPTDQLQRIGVKLFVADSTRISPRELVPIFHRWIQTHAIHQLLIDVADYDHLGEGPRVVLVAHEGNFVIDNSGGRLGLQYFRKQPVDGPLTGRLEALCRILVRGATLLEEDPALEGRIRFRGEELEIVANDWLLAPNADGPFEAMRAALRPLLERLYPGQSCTITRNPDPGERLTMTCLAPTAVTRADIAGRLAG